MDTLSSKTVSARLDREEQELFEVAYVQACDKARKLSLPRPTRGGCIKQAIFDWCDNQLIEEL